MLFVLESWTFETFGNPPDVSCFAALGHIFGMIQQCMIASIGSNYDANLSAIHSPYGNVWFDRRLSRNAERETRFSLVIPLELFACTYVKTD